MLFISFFILSFFILSIPFLPEPPFRVFDPPGIHSFHCPIFAWVAFIDCQSAGCSFLPKPPFRVFDLASFSFSSFHFSFFHFHSVFHSCHWSQIIPGNNLLVTCIEIDIDTHLFMHVSLECTLLLRFALKIDRKRFFNFQRCLFQILTLSNRKKVFCI
jgi:hypothetical protein